MINTVAKLNSEHRKVLIETFQEMLEKGPQRNPKNGICNNAAHADKVYSLGIYPYGIVPELAADWPHNNTKGGVDFFCEDGTRIYDIYPVPLTRKSDGGYESVWEGKQLEYRKDLLRHMIKKLEAIGE